MWEDTDHINAFYETQTGHHISQRLQPVVDQFWASGSGTQNAAFGYPFPFISRVPAAPAKDRQPDKEPILCFTPRWMGSNDLSLLPAQCHTMVNAHQWPLQDVQLDRLMLGHALEFNARPDLILAESWRVLDGSGKLLVMVAHRHGLWTQADRTPFGQGQPFSRGQLRSLLVAAGFEVTTLRCAIHVPPAVFRWMAGAAPTIEAIGQRVWPMLGGVLIAEANKMLYAPAGNTSKLRRPGGLQPARLASHTGRSFSAAGANRN